MPAGAPGLVGFAGPALEAQGSGSSAGALGSQLTGSPRLQHEGHRRETGTEALAPNNGGLGWRGKRKLESGAILNTEPMTETRGNPGQQRVEWLWGAK